MVTLGAAVVVVGAVAVVVVGAEVVFIVCNNCSKSWRSCAFTALSVVVVGAAVVVAAAAFKGTRKK